MSLPLFNELVENWLSFFVSISNPLPDLWGKQGIACVSPIGLCFVFFPSAFCAPATFVGVGNAPYKTVSEASACISVRVFDYHCQFRSLYTFFLLKVYGLLFVCNRTFTTPVIPKNTK